MLDYLDIAKWDDLMCQLTEEGYDLYKNSHSSGYICRNDDDGWLKLAGLPSGTSNIQTFDAIKQFSAILKFRTDDYVKPDPFEEWCDFDQAQHEFTDGLVHTASWLLRFRAIC